MSSSIVPANGFVHAVLNMGLVGQVMAAMAGVSHGDRMKG